MYTDRELRIWSIKVRRAMPRCIICGTLKGREAHHLYSKAHHPDKALDVNLGVTLCNYKGNRCHTTFHSEFMGGTRRKCTAADFDRFRATLAFAGSVFKYYIDRKLSNDKTV